MTSSPTASDEVVVQTSVPMSVWTHIVEFFLENEIRTELEDHICDALAPCAVLKRALQQCYRVQLVCHEWNATVMRFLDDRKYVKMKRPSEEAIRSLSYGSAFVVSYRCSLGGKFRAYQALEDDYEKCVVLAHDYGGPNGCRRKGGVVIKISNSRTQYENERDVYSWLGYAPISTLDIPQLHFSGEYGLESGYYGLVLDKLGPDLDKMRLKSRHERYTPQQTLAVAIQLIQIYQRLHSQGWLHCNAKPGNFAIGSDEPGRNNRIFVFDFEHARRIEPTPVLRKREECGGWNRLFKATTWEMHITPSRRDDLEGLGYVLSYLERGSLPWEHISPEEIWRVKICTPTAKIFEGMDPVYMTFFNYVKALAWGEIPDYDWILKSFMDVWTFRGFHGIPDSMDLWELFGLRL